MKKPTTRPTAAAKKALDAKAAHARLVLASEKVLGEIDRLALVCDGTAELRAAIAEARGAGA